MFSYLNPLPSLTQYTGPYKVSVSDYEIPVSELQSTSTIPNSQISTIKFRIYYPTTPDATSKESVYWLPNPQKQWNEAFASFLGANSRWSPLVSSLWSITNYIKIPAIKNGPLAPPKSSVYPVCFFSHGLGGNTNIYSSIVGSLASCGVVTIVPEHRDGSSPVSFIRNAKGEIETTIPYQKLSHSPDPKTLNARNAQLRVRLWELEQTYTVIKAMNEGKQFSNYAEPTKEPPIQLKSQLNLQPGQVTWAGHSFGAATITQFVKSIFYHQYLPSQKPSNTDKQGWDWTPLYQTQAESDLVKQITPESPVALLDIWTMPLRGDSTSWLWERPMPCYSRQSPATNGTPNTVAMISGEFYRYEGILNRTRALLSRSPASAIEKIEGGKETKSHTLPPALEPTQSNSNPIAEISKQEIPQTATHTSPSPLSSSSQSSLDHQQTPAPAPPTSSPSSSPSAQPHLYHIPHSAHLSQSDFAPLFPTLTKYAMKAIDPHKTLELNVRAILAVMCGQGLHAEGLVVRDGVRDLAGEEYLLGGDSKGVSEKERGRRSKEGERWVRVELVE